MGCLSEFLENEEDNERDNGILEIADEYAESEACMEKDCAQDDFKRS